LIPIPANKWQLISERFPKTPKNCTLRVLLSKSTESDSTLYGAYPFSHNFSMIPSMFRFSWEKAFYGVENPNGLTDPEYDQKIEVNKKTLADKEIAVEPVRNNSGSYIKLLIPTVPKLANQGHDIIYVPSSTLKLADKEYNEADFSGKDLKLFFKSKDSLLTTSNSKNNKDTYWLIRLFGTLEGSNDAKTVLAPNIYFVDKPKSDNPGFTCFTTPWVPNFIKPDCGFSTNPLKFDICFPILISAFLKTLDHIELNLQRNDIDKTTTSKKFNTTTNKVHIKCCLEIYRMTRLLSGVRYEIL
jgi:hypothetical protein